jgi:hypothetical protein
VPSGSTVIIYPGISNDGGTGHTFFAVTGSILDTSDNGPNADTTQFRFTGRQGGGTVDTGIFTPAATRHALANDGSASINFLGAVDSDCGNCYGPSVVATITFTGSVPALSPVAAGGLAALLLLSGFWLLRYRRAEGRVS